MSSLRATIFSYLHLTATPIVSDYGSVEGKIYITSKGIIYFVNQHTSLSQTPPVFERPPLRLAVLVSGSGSNLQALIDAIEGQQLMGVKIVLVVSNIASAQGLQR